MHEMAMSDVERLVGVSPGKVTNIFLKLNRLFVLERLVGKTCAVKAGVL